MGAGGNVGAVCYGLGFRELSYSKAYNIMGYSVIASAILSACYSIKGHRGLLHGEDLVVNKETGEIIADAKEADGTCNEATRRPSMV